MKKVLVGRAPRRKGGAMAGLGALVLLSAACGGTRAGQAAAGGKDEAGARALRAPPRALLTLLAHTNVHTAAFSPDGRRLAAGGPGHTVKVWDARGGKELLSLAGHRHEVYDVAFSPDGRWIASAGSDGARVWDAATGAPAFTTRGQSFATRVAFSPDGTRLAVAGSPVIKVWDVATGGEVRTFLRNRRWESSAVFSPDGGRVFSGNIDREVTAWDARTGQALLTLKGHTSVVHTVAVSPDGSRLASASLDKTVRLWEAATGREVLVIRGHRGGVHSVAFSPDGQSLASAGTDRTVRVWDARTGQELLALEAHTGDAYSAAFSPDGGRLVSTGPDGAVKVWDVAQALGVRAVPLRPAEVEVLWGDLAGPDAAQAYRAVWRLAAAPEQAVPFLRQRLRPVPPPDGPRQERLARLVANLDSDLFAERERASGELQRLGELAEPALRRALAGRTSLEVRRRAERLLEPLASAAGSPGRLRARRAVGVLEHIDTPAARALLVRLGAGAPGAWLTREARAALERRARRFPGRP